MLVSWNCLRKIAQREIVYADAVCTCSFVSCMVFDTRHVDRHFNFHLSLLTSNQQKTIQLLLSVAGSILQAFQEIRQPHLHPSLPSTQYNFFLSIPPNP